MAKEVRDQITNQKQRNLNIDNKSKKKRSKIE